MQQQYFQQQQHDPRMQIKNDLGLVVDDMERALRDLPETAADLKQRATIRLGEVRNRLNAMEPVRTAGQRAGSYVRQHPWAAVGGVALTAYLIGVLRRSTSRSQTRRH